MQGTPLHCIFRVQEMVFDRCWEESMFRIRELEVPEISVNKSVKDVQQVDLCIFLDAHVVL